MLEEIGASISDVFSADKVVWVEGPTERECFKEIVVKHFDGPIPGLDFIALRNTGDFESKRSADSAAVLDIYDALSQGGSILPVTIAFSFDGEGKNESKINDLMRRCKGRAHILPRRMTENYLLHPTSISTVLNNLGAGNVTPSDVERLLAEFAPHRLPKGTKAEWPDSDAVKTVDAAKLLEDVFLTASDRTHDYRKVRDAVEILKLIMDIAPDETAELVDYVRKLIDVEARLQ
jgi:hypothetical protein